MTNPPPPDKIELWLVFQNNFLLVNIIGNDNKLLTNAAIASMKSRLTHQHKLAQLDAYDVYCAELQHDYPAQNDLELIPFRKALELLGDDWYNIATRAYSIINWDKNHQYCGHCGSPTEHRTGTFERVCPSCSLIFYPRISPSIIVLIQKDDQALLARGPLFPPGAYGLIAGFVESGESVEDAVHREVAEEVGITIKNLRFFGSQPWPFPDSLMIAFTADYDAGELTINPDEIEAAGWYHYDNIPGRPSSSISIAQKLISHFIAEQKHKSLK